MIQVKLNNHIISRNSTPFIIAEAGINHNGEIEKAVEMVKVAKHAGADCVKFQTFKAEEFVADPNQMYTYLSKGEKITESMQEMFKRCEFSRDEWLKIKKKCDEEKIMFLSTPLNKSDLDFLQELGIQAIKIGSGDFTNLPFLKYCSSTKLPMIVSCGMSDLTEIFQALNTIGTLDGYPTILLLTTSEYPTPPENVNLLKLRSLSETFPMVPIGFSDHTQGPLASSLAIPLGACVFEKHFTLDHNLLGPDHWFSEDPKGIKIWIDSIRKAHLMMGNPIIRPTKKELQNKKEFQKVIVANKEIRKGEIFDENNLAIKRIPGGKGLSPSRYEELIGKKATRDFNEGNPIES